MTATPPRTYPCCPHCADDVIHDVPKDGHDLPCDLCRASSPDEERAQLIRLARRYDLDNHHNAALCPYCTPAAADGNTWPRVITLHAPVELAVGGPGVVTFDGQQLRWTAS